MCILKCSITVSDFFAFLFGVAKWVSLVSIFSEFADGILKTFQFIFICFIGGGQVQRRVWVEGGGGEGRGTGGFIHIHLVSWTIDPFFTLLILKYQVVSTICEKCLLCYLKSFNLNIKILYINLSIFLVLKVQYAFFFWFPQSDLRQLRHCWNFSFKLDLCLRKKKTVGFEIYLLVVWLFNFNLTEKDKKKKYQSKYFVFWLKSSANCYQCWSTSMESLTRKPRRNKHKRVFTCCSQCVHFNFLHKRNTRTKNTNNKVKNS